MEAHGKVLSQALELTAYPIIRRFLAPLLLELVQGLLQDMIWSNLLRFRFLPTARSISEGLEHNNRKQSLQKSTASSP